MRYHLLLRTIAIGIVLLPVGCAQIKQISDALTNLQRLQFKLGAVHNFRLAGVELSSKASASDFSPIGDGLKLLDAFRSKKLPADFILDLEVRNPNDGTQGRSAVPATLAGLEFRLLIDDQPTITGNLDREVEIPASGSVTAVPIRISLDLYEFFGSRGYDKLLELALAIGGKNGSASRLKLDAKPTVRTKFGLMTYPGRIAIVDREFRN
ncbi:MAG: hypothetical protein KatS3mg038_0510 [Candidatus Kapaibacterium sp.]|nr:MAG: hypothetical protein KatS3mg038_0510 [Candidatus Kapabacteria bacterium]GIV56604.1 MAG: hypothetical protein KatS3mg040_1372 [Candidatus Kapabacteria bacterium]